VSTTAKEKLGNPFEGITDAEGNAIPGNGEGDEETTEGLHAVADDIERMQAAADAKEETDAGGENLFNPGAYDNPELQLAKVDGQSIDKIGIAFSGSVKLDRSTPDDCSLFRRLMLGKVVTLKVDAKVVGVATKGKDDSDGNTDAVVETKTLSVNTIYPLSIED
jgi:hypothetical protein